MAIRFLFPPSLGKRAATVRAELLAQSLSPWLGQPVVVEVAKSYEDLEQRLLAGDTDVAWAPPVLCARAVSSARAVLKAVRSGRSSYRAALVGRTEDALQPDDLQGLRAAWVDRRSTSGYLLAVAALHELGHEPDTLFSDQRFRGSFKVALEAVLDNEADVSSVFVHRPERTALRRALAEHVGPRADRLAAILYTGESPTDGLVVTAGLSPEDAGRLLQVLIPPHDQSPPLAVFDLFDAEAFELAEPADFDALRPVSGPFSTIRVDRPSGVMSAIPRVAEDAASRPLSAYDFAALAVDPTGICRQFWTRSPFSSDEPVPAVTGRSLTQLFGDHPGEALMELLARAQNAGERSRHEYCLENGGDLRWFSAEVVGPADESQGAWLLVIQENTEQRQLESTLVEFASYPLLDPNPNIELATDGAVRYLNPSARAHFPDLLERDGDHPLVEALGSLTDLFEACAESPSRRRVTLESRTYELTISVVPDGSTLRLYAVDITTQDRTERALRLSEQRYRLLFETNMAGVYHVTIDGTILDCNTAFAQLLGVDSPAELRLRPFPSLFFETDALEQRRQRIERGASAANLEVGLKHRDGHAVWVLMSEHLVELEPGYATVQGTVVDISERRQIESNMLQTAQLLSIGTLAAGVAHELNNPLTSVLGNLFVATEELQQLRKTSNPADSALQGELAELAEMLLEAREGADRARTIVRDMRAFSRVDEETTQALDVHEVLETAIKMSRSELRHRARLVKTFGSLPPIDANEARLGQVFLNLLVNAAQACPPGRASDNQIQVLTRTNAAGNAVIEVHDTGSGVPERLLSRIFEPFFTTKPIGIGTGLGLSISHTIVRRLGGEIEVERKPDKGSVFRVILPPAAPSDAVDSPPSGLPAVGPARVLIVDDERGAAHALRRSLEPCDVVVASSGQEAVERLATDDAFDVVVCDLLMPGLTGMELYEIVKAKDVDLSRRFLFVTGAVFTPEVRRFLDAVPNPRLEKPFEPAHLRALVNEMAQVG